MSDPSRFEPQLRAVLEAAGWRVRAARSREQGADLVVRAGAVRYAVTLKDAGEARRALLEGHLASAILRARAAATAADAAPLAIVCAPSISEPLLNELGAFVARFGGGVAWGAMDDAGLVVLHGVGLEAVRRPRRRGHRPALPARSDTFSDRGQWMLKVLLGHRLPPDQRFVDPQGHPIDEPIVNAMALAKVAGVSVATAARCVVALKAEGFLLARAPDLELLRVETLLEQWRAVYQRPPLEVRTCWVFPARDPVKQLDAAIQRARSAGLRACLGLFAACDRLGWGFVRGVAPHLYVDRASPDGLQPLGLRLADPGEAADVLVRQPRYPEAVFRGARDRDGTPVADVLQCWLDVVNNPARGDEMAEHLYAGVIRPSLIERDP